MIICNPHEEYTGGHLTLRTYENNEISNSIVK